MKPIKRIVSLCLMLCILLSLLPAGVFAEAHTLPESMQFTYINPLYADSVTQWDLVQPGQPLLYADNTGDGKYYDAETAGQMIRDDLVARDTTISVNVSFPYNADTIEQDMQKLVLDIMASAMEHTGNPVEGDYLLWQYTGFEVGFGNYTFSGGDLGATVTFTMTYHSSAAQEAAVDSAVAQLLSQLNVAGKDDYTKVKAIYDYITANITYDYDNLQNNSYKLKHTAYAALINKTAVCQGYAVLLYRLALELGVDCRMIPGNSDGQGHVWNIAKLDGKYYNLDATWDAGLPIYQCFLVGSDNFDNHDRWDTPGQMPSKDNYNSAAFHAAYPMSKTDYTPATQQDWVASGTCGEKLTWTLDKEGTLTVSGTGEMANWSYEVNAPWYKYRDQIKAVVVSSGVTSIGAHAFNHCSSLMNVVLPESITSVGSLAFASCSSLTSIVLPDSITSISDQTFWECNNLSNITLPDNLTSIGHSVFQGCTNLSSVDIPDSVTSIDILTFSNCYSLRSIALPDDITCISMGLFESCSSLTSIVLPDSITSIGDKAFTCCRNLTEIIFTGNAPAFGVNIFTEVNATCYYPAGDSSWTDSVKQNYGGNLNWVATCGEHKFGGATYTWSDDFATCTAVHTCINSKCTVKETETVSSTVITQVATCTQEGKTTYTAEFTSGVFENQIKVVTITQLGHDMGDWETTKEATCTEEGNQRRDCSRCDHFEAEAIPTVKHQYSEKVTAPTCTEAGYTTYTCTCGDSFVSDKVDVLGHTWDAGKVTKEPTEEATGVRTFTCTACGATRTEEIPKLNHTHKYTTVVTAPTCTETGYTTYTCACGDIYTADEVAALGHNAETDKGYAATCTEAGLSDGKHCSRCNAVLTKQETIPALGHSWDEGKVTKEPTEEATGVRTFTCTACGATRTEEIPKLDHVHNHTAAVTAPTCTEKGYTTYTCACGDTYTADEAAALGHNEVTDKGYAATCTEAGLTDGVHCDRCNTVLTAQEVISALGHQEVIDKGYAATCTETGLTDGKHCDRCNSVLIKQETIPASGHAYDEGKVTKEPTEEATGIRTYTCTTCGATRTEEIPKLDHTHKYATVVTAPTCTEKGYTTYTCVCGDTYTADEVAALGHNEVTDQGYAPTCTEEGLSDGVHCDRCGAVLTAQTVIPAAGHDFADGTCRCGAKAVVITAEPKTGFAKMDEVAKATVVAEGEGLKYQWYIRNENQDKFSKSACTGDTYSCRMNEKSKNRRALCIITDQYGNRVQSKTIVIREAVSIVTEPKHTMAKFGEQVKVTMEASGDGLTYQWYFRNADQSEYHKASVTDATYTCKMRDLSNNRRLLCIVKDKYGNKVQTKTVVIRMAATITAQPQSVSAKKGEVVETTVQAVGTDLKYQWYIKNAGSEKFVKSSITDATYTVTMSKKVDGREAYCVVTDKYGKTARSSVITLTMETK